MLMRTDPFREIDRLTQEMWGPHSRLAMMPMTAYHDEGTFVVHLDIPGVKPETIDVTVDRNVLSVRAERTETGPQTGERLIEERSYGTFTRQLVLDDALDVDHLTADYDAGVLTLRIPIAEQAKPRRVEIKSGQDMHELSA